MLRVAIVLCLLACSNTYETRFNELNQKFENYKLEKNTQTSKLGQALSVAMRNSDAWLNFISMVSAFEKKDQTSLAVYGKKFKSLGLEQHEFGALIYMLQCFLKEMGK